MKLYKLTNEDNKTRNNTQWGENVTHEIIGKDFSAPLCSRFWLHAYESAKLAVLMNPVHAGFENPVLWEAEGEVIKNDGTKVVVIKLKTIKEINIPVFTIEQKVAFGILCALKVYKDKEFKKWAVNWLNGKDRSKESANTAATNARGANVTAAAHATYAAANATVYYATHAAAYYAAGAADYAADYAAIHINKTTINTTKKFHPAYFISVYAKIVRLNY